MEPPTVLIADDDLDMRLYLRSCLESLGPRIARVIEAADGLTALRFARSGVVDVLISDVVMPGLDGRALCDAIRAEYGFVSDGGFAEFVRAPARNAVSLPASVSDADAAPIGCGVTTALHAAKLANVGLDDWVVVYGVGAVGYGLVQVARLRGARVIAVGRTPAKLEKARALGAEAIVRAGAEDVAARIREITGGRGADVVFELVATRDTMAASLASLAKRGRLVFVGYSEDSLQVHPIQLVVGEQVVTASVGNTLAELRLAVDLVASGRVATVVDRTLPLERFQEGIDALAAGRLVGRAVLAP